MSTEGHNKAGAGADDELTLAQKLDRLLKTVFPEGRGPYTLREVSEGVARQEQLKQEQLLRAGARNLPKPVTISFSYLSQLRSGAKTNPSARQLAALADFFGVPLAYLFGGGAEVEDDVEAEIALKQAMRDAGIRDLALRASHLTPSGRHALIALLEGLEDAGLAKRKRRRRSGSTDEPQADQD